VCRALPRDGQACRRGIGQEPTSGHFLEELDRERFKVDMSGTAQGSAALAI